MHTEPLAPLITGRGFDHFLDQLREQSPGDGLDFEFEYCQPTDNPAMRLDVDSPLYMGRMTAWESGACYLEVLDISNGETVFAEHHEVDSEEQLYQVCARLLQFMRTPVAPSRQVRSSDHLLH